MSSNCLYITAREAGSGKSTVALGVMEILLKKIEKVGFFRPILNPRTQDGQDPDLNLIRNYFKLKMPYESMYGVTVSEAEQLLSSGKRDELFERILEKYSQAKECMDFILCEGIDFLSSDSALKVDFDPVIIQELSCPVLMVAKVRGLSTEDAVSRVHLNMSPLVQRSCEVVSIILNQTDSVEQGKEIISELKKEEAFNKVALFSVPYESAIGFPTIKEVAEALNAEVILGEKYLYRHVTGFSVAAMQLRHFLARLRHGTMVITPGDRADILLACMASFSSNHTEKISGIVLTGKYLPEEPIMNLIKGYGDMVPILSVEKATYPTAVAIDRLHFNIDPGDDRKINRSLALFEEHINVEELVDLVATAESKVMTPKSFEFTVMQRARELKKRIVLPEGHEDRILMATENLVRRGIVDITLLGNEDEIRRKIKQLGLRMGEIEIIDPISSPHLDDFARTYIELRRHKRVFPMENARDRLLDLNYFGTMMVHHGLADGMVSGSIHSTAATIKPAFEIIKSKPDMNVVSSIFFMCLADKVLVYGDCAINPNPDAEALAQIAMASAQTARMFGIEPRVAMLSYSTGTSGKGKDVDKVREATEIVRSMNPDFLVEGPIQYDAAVDPHVAKTKLPDSPVAGRATVFIFPDLNTGNNSYKAVQRSSGAIAVGPVLQGLKKPVNDLSRGCLVSDIINTVAITAVQAGNQSE